MWSGEHRVTAHVDPDAVWLRWVDTAYWPVDDPDTKAAGYDDPGSPPQGTWSEPEGTPAERPGADRAPQPGATGWTPQPGATGWIKPGKGPLSHFTVVRADREGGRFDLQTRFPGATMHFEHQLRSATASESGAGSGAAVYELIHRVRFSGPAAAVWGALVGRSIAAGFPRVMANIVQHAGGVVRI